MLNHTLERKLKILLSELGIKPLKDPDISPSSYYLYRNLSRLMRNKVYKTKDEVKGSPWEV